MKRSFYWGVRCTDIGHVRKLGDVATGDTFPPPFPHASPFCHCGSRVDLDRVWAYDAKTNAFATADELRAAWEEI